jgi:hypothetical protein
MVAMFSVTMSLLLSAVAGLSPIQRPASISGVITDTSGRGLPGATVTVVSEDDLRRAAVTGPGGQYVIAGLAPGRYAVEARMGGFDTKATELAISAGSDAVWSGALLVGPAFGEMSIEHEVMRFTGSDALDCGRYSGPISGDVLQRALVCAMASVQTRRPFSVIVQHADGRSRGQGLLGGPDGLVQVFEYEKGAASFRSKACASPRVSEGRDRLHGGFEFTCQP